MGVYIKDAKMPNSCVECKTNRINIVCEKWENIVDDISFRRADDCPLIEVTEPHGRLIDVGKIDAYKLPIEKQESSEWHKHSAVYKYAAPVFNGALDMVKDHAPTVIEAEYTVIEAEGES